MSASQSQSLHRWIVTRLGEGFMFGRDSSVRGLRSQAGFDSRASELECEAIHGDPYVVALLRELAVIEARFVMAGIPSFRGMTSFPR